MQDLLTESVCIHQSIGNMTLKSSFCGGAFMEEKYMDKLYELLEKAEKEKDSEVIAVLRWVIFNLENR